MADRAKRRGVATLLLTLETSVWDKVPALAEIGMHSDTAVVATAARLVLLIICSFTCVSVYLISFVIFKMLPVISYPVFLSSSTLLQQQLSTEIRTSSSARS